MVISRNVFWPVRYVYYGAGYAIPNYYNYTEVPDYVEISDNFVKYSKTLK